MGFGAKMSLGVTLPVAIMGKAVFDAASNMNESMGKIGVVFGKSEAEIVKWSEKVRAKFRTIPTSRTRSNRHIRKLIPSVWNRPRKI
jgi:hypothetical protein